MGNVPPKSHWPPPAPPKSAVRRLATERDFGAPIRLVVLFRAPPPIVMVAGSMWVDDSKTRVRKVTVLGVWADERTFAIELEAIRRTHAWVGYGHERNGRGQMLAGAHLLLTTGPLDPRERDITWAWGWKSKSAKALQVTEALR